MKVVKSKHIVIIFIFIVLISFLVLIVMSKTGQLTYDDLQDNSILESEVTTKEPVIDEPVEDTNSTDNMIKYQSRTNDSYEPALPIEVPDNIDMLTNIEIDSDTSLDSTENDSTVEFIPDMSKVYEKQIATLKLICVMGNVNSNAAVQITIIPRDELDYSYSHLTVLGEVSTDDTSKLHQSKDVNVSDVLSEGGSAVIVFDKLPASNNMSVLIDYINDDIDDSAINAMIDVYE